MYFASTQFYFGLTGIYSTLVRIFNGIVNSEVIFYSAVGIAGCMIGNFIGKRAFDRLNAQSLKRAVYVGMTVSGIIMAVS